MLRGVVGRRRFRKAHIVLTATTMKFFAWDAAKNETLRSERGISFEEIVFHIERGDVLDILEHPNQRRYGEQRIFVVRVSDYVYLVPFVESESEVFLKTVIPSRKATKRYLHTKEPKDG
jgi:uncharacterized DUF497 family protein